MKTNFLAKISRIQFHFLSVFCLFFLLTGCVGHSTPTGQGLLYTAQNSPIAMVKSEIPPIENLKIGKASCNNLFGLVSTGDCSIHAAARNGNISEVYYIDKKVMSFLFFGAAQTTIVYGK